MIWMWNIDMDFNALSDKSSMNVNSMHSMWFIHRHKRVRGFWHQVCDSCPQKLLSWDTAHMHDSMPLSLSTSHSYFFQMSFMYIVPPPWYLCRAFAAWKKRFCLALKHSSDKTDLLVCVKLNSKQQWHYRNNVLTFSDESAETEPAYILRMQQFPHSYWTNQNSFWLVSRQEAID